MEKKIGRPLGSTKKTNNLKNAYNNNIKNIVPFIVDENKGVSIDTKSKAYIVTNKIQILKNLINIMKKYKDIYVYIIKNVGLFFEKTNSSDATISARMLCDRFDVFEVKKNIAFKLDTYQFLNILKDVKDDASMILEIPDDSTNDIDVLVIKMIYTKKNSVEMTELKIKEETYNSIPQTTIEYPVIIEMISKNFQNIIKTLKNMSCDNIEMIIMGSKLIIKNKTYCTSGTGEYGEVENEFKFLKTSENPIAKRLKISMITNFLKCSQFSTMIKLYFSNNDKLCVEYDIGSLGTVQIMLDEPKK